MDFPKELIETLRLYNNQLSQDFQKKRIETEEAQKKEKLITNLLEYLNKGWPMHFLTMADQQSDLLKRMKITNPYEIGILEYAYRFSKEETTNIFKRYPNLLEEKCREFRITLDRNSSHPKYSVKNGFFKIEIVEARRVAVLSDYEGKLIELAADIEPVVEALRKEYIRVFDRKFQGIKFLKQLRSNYKIFIQKKHLPDGSSVPIKDIVKLIKKKNKKFRLDEFIADLSSLVEKGPFEIEERTIDFQQTKDTKQGILLIDNSIRGYIGYVVFKEKL